MQPAGEEHATPLDQVDIEGRKFICPEETCRQEFKKENHLKVHYALKHFEMPK